MSESLVELFVVAFFSVGIIAFLVPVGRFAMRLLAGSPRALAAPPTPPAPTPADQRTFTLTTPRGGIRVAQLSGSADDECVVSVESDGPAYDRLFAWWVELRPERESMVFLHADPDAPLDPSRVVITETDAGDRVGRLPVAEAVLYHGVITALTERSLTCTAYSKITGGTGSRSRVALKLNLDSPRRIAADFQIAPERLVVMPAPQAAAPIPESANAPSLATGRGYFYEVVGESHYQEALLRASEGAPDGRFTARLVLEPENPHDPNAVAVHSPDGETVGYLPADDAVLYARLLTDLLAHEVAPVCPATLVGGSADKLNLGVRLDLDRPTNIAKRFGVPVPRRPRVENDAQPPA